mmetsp:Transcript_38440/g.68793  ORF Transcript_38440/g.68793 Transcript_38440/m.68793 type:complete len:81 (-) Transcript_38440:2062-2304(-)
MCLEDRQKKGFNPRLASLPPEHELHLYLYLVLLYVTKSQTTRTIKQYCKQRHGQHQDVTTAKHKGLTGIESRIAICSTYI